MNLLAHSVLAFDDAALLAGQFAGDFVRGPDLSGWSPRVAAGIRLHRRVDAFTDAHPLVVAARSEFEPALRRHAGVIIDVVFDHLLARAWPRPAGRTLAEHARWVDASLTAHGPELPAALVRFAGFVRAERVLERNTEPAAVARTLERLSRRSERMAPLALAAGQVDAIAVRLDAPFTQLWPVLERMARDALADAPGSIRAAASEAAGGDVTANGTKGGLVDRSDEEDGSDGR